MLATDSINALSGARSASVAAKPNQLTQDDFITLLLAQMKLQTPENPFDSNTMMQQVSQLTTLSATHQMEDAVKSLNSNLGISQILTASQLVGKKVQVGNELSPLIAGEGLSGGLLLPNDVDNLTVTISDMSGKVVKTLSIGPSSSGVLDFHWDGQGDDNKALEAGFYKIAATTVANGQTLSVPTAGTFKVNSVALGRSGEGVILNLDGIGGVKMQDLVKIL